MGDPTGIGPEILVRALAGAGGDRFHAVVVGDARIIARGEALAAAPLPAGVERIDLRHCHRRRCRSAP